MVVSDWSVGGASAANTTLLKEINPTTDEYFREE
jgi:hypothetical protein